MGAHYRQEFFQNVIHKRIAFFDKSTNSAGSLTAKISTDAMQIQQILGGETAIQIVGILGIIGSLIIAFYYGWKLSMVGSIIMPIVITAGYYRVRLERDVERGNAKLFAETAQFSSEAIGAFRTVAALTMEDSITQKFEYQLQRHTKDALKKARVSTVVMAISESIDMFCQALFFWLECQLSILQLEN
jgi:ATP-binding cassette subfamily B (MDR/TAP) protein 1